MNEIHVSQIPLQWEGVCTYANDLIYDYKNAMRTSKDCREYLERKVRQLKQKLADTPHKGYQTRYSSQIEIYESILKYLTLYKL